MRYHTITILIGFAAIGLTGCGEKVGEVHGKVTYNGQPLNSPGGMIIFIGPNQEQVPVSIGEDGSYQAPGVAVGPNKVAVYYPNPNLKKNKLMLKKGQAKSTEPLPPLYLTPESYANPESSGLTVDISPGKEFNVNLQGPPIP
jgi:hypothetical protein